MAMICWDRVGDHLVIGVFTEAEIDRLREYLWGLRDLLDERFADYTTDCLPGHQLGLPFPTSETTDRRLRAILRRRSVDGSQWQEPEVFRPLHKAIGRVLATLPDSGGLVELHSIDCALAWDRSLTDLWVAMAASVRGGDPVVESRVRFTTRWLRTIVRTLDEAATKAIEPVPQELADSISQVRTFWI
jgi:hypothetical protein